MRKSGGCDQHQDRRNRQRPPIPITHASNPPPPPTPNPVSPGDALGTNPLARQPPSPPPRPVRPPRAVPSSEKLRNVKCRKVRTLCSKPCTCLGTSPPRGFPGSTRARPAPRWPRGRRTGSGTWSRKAQQLVCNRSSSIYEIGVFEKTNLERGLFCTSTSSSLSAGAIITVVLWVAGVKLPRTGHHNTHVPQ